MDDVGSRSPSPPIDRTVRREVANSNERRRMQNINDGFEALREVLPHEKTIKLSKAAILQCTVQYVNTLEEDRRVLAQQNSDLKLALQASNKSELVKTFQSPVKRKYPNNIGKVIRRRNMMKNLYMEEVKSAHQQVMELKYQLEQERHVRITTEHQSGRHVIPKDINSTPSPVKIDHQQTPHSRRSLDAIIDAINHLEQSGEL